MKKKRLLLCFILIANMLSAQEFSTKIGKVSKEDIELMTYSADTTAEAVVVYEEKILKYDVQKWQFTLYYKLKMKILKSEGVDYANFAIPTRSNLHDKEYLNGLSAISYNLENGKVVKTEASKQHISAEQINENLKITKIYVPNVHAGTIVELKYNLTSDFVKTIPAMEVQRSIPVAQVHYEYQIPEYFVFKVNNRGNYTLPLTQSRGLASVNVSQSSVSYGPSSLTGSVSQPTVNYGTMQYQTNDYHCDATNIPALKKEPYVYCMNDFLSRIEFEMSSFSIPGHYYKTINHSWNDVDESIDAMGFTSCLRIPYPFEDKVKEIAASSIGDYEKLHEALKLVQSKMAWNGVYSLFSNNPVNAAKEGQGNSAEVNFVLNSVLRDLGFETNAILLRPRGFGYLYQPNLYDIDAFIIEVKMQDRNVYVDATDKKSDINLFSTDLLVSNAHRYKSNINLNLDSMFGSGNQQNANISAVLKEDGTINANVLIQSKRQCWLTFKDANPTENDYKKNLEKEDVEVNSLEIQSEGTEGRVKVNFTIQANESGDLIYLKSPLLNVNKANPFNSPYRELPIQFDYPFSNKIVCNFRIPDGYQVVEFPKSVSYSACDNAVTCQYKAMQMGNSIQIVISFDLQKEEFKASEYNDLKQIFAVYQQICDNQIVLKK